MSDSEQARGAENPQTDPEIGPSSSSVPQTDLELEALLDFEPVPRRFKKEDGWTAPLQRAFIAELARHGSPTRACEALGKVRSGVDKLYKSAKAESFRSAWDKAVELAERRRAEDIRAEHSAAAGLTPPFVDHRRSRSAAPAGPLPGQMLNEHGEWEDADSIRRRGEEAKDSICTKLLNCRRLYLQEISGNPGMRAAFEILTELPIDWDKAERLEPQADEPWRKPNMREPDMVLTAESGWMMGEHGYGEDKKKALQEALNQHLIEQGQEPIDWSAEGSSAENKTTDGKADTSAYSRDARPGRPTGRVANPIDVTNSVRDGTAASPSPSPAETPDVIRGQDKPGPRVRRI